MFPHLNVNDTFQATSMSRTFSESAIPNTTMVCHDSMFVQVSKAAKYQHN